jgi:hypothetical protein
MGFFAGELENVLRNHISHPQGSPWSILARMNVHPQQIDRLKKAADDIGQVATLPDVALQQLRIEIELTPLEWSRLQAGIEADVFLRMLLYHSYPLEDAVNTANSIFAAMLKDRLATGGGEVILPELSDAVNMAIQAGRGRRGRGIRRRVEAQPDEIAELQRQIALQTKLPATPPAEEMPERKSGRGRRS